MKLNSPAAHMCVDQYGSFRLTDAIRPAPDHGITPRQGYRIDTYHDVAAGVNVPVLAAAISREGLFDLFLALLEPLGEEVDVILETSHKSRKGAHRDLYREDIDLPVLLSHFCDFEDLLLNDGCTGIAVVSKDQPMELQFDEHKLLVVYARTLGPAEAVLRRAGIRRDDHLKLISEGEHLHLTDPRYQAEFEDMALRISVDQRTGQVSW